MLQLHKNWFFQKKSLEKINFIIILNMMRIRILILFFNQNFHEIRW